MMDCQHLTLNKLIDTLYVCKEYLKLDGEKCVDFIYFALAPSHKGALPMKHCAWSMYTRPLDLIWAAFYYPLSLSGSVSTAGL